MSLWVVVGGQFGSEGKGKVSAVIARREHIDICVRCGGPNSGHSFVDTDVKPVVLRQLPTGFVNPRTRLLLPAGALVDPMVLKREIEVFGISPLRIGIDPQCFVIEERDRETERNLRLNEKLSSTLCGVGAAISRRVLRGDDAKLVRDALGEYPWLADLMVKESVSKELNIALDRGKSVLIEGTQGFGLSIYHSEHYPRCTSRDTTASGFLSEVGVSPRLVTEIIVVFRTFEIRVAGQQAGPMKDEITWETLQNESGYTYPIEEHTSVTRKVRRVGRFDWELARVCVQVNRPTRLAVNGLDYLEAPNREARAWDELTLKARAFVDRLHRQTGVVCNFLGTGPSLAQVIPHQPSDYSQSRHELALGANFR